MQSVDDSPASANMTTTRGEVAPSCVSSLPTLASSLAMPLLQRRDPLFQFDGLERLPPGVQNPRERDPLARHQLPGPDGLQDRLLSLADPGDG